MKLPEGDASFLALILLMKIYQVKFGSAEKAGQIVKLSNCRGAKR
jgi:hypothetical protein